ncbi:MAG: hypothetical protein GY795_43650 [Desulfobacterales bacterium]|nr:hypothetical protein [Desulfobacterales bacterium]
MSRKTDVGCRVRCPCIRILKHRASLPAFGGIAGEPLHRWQVRLPPRTVFLWLWQSAWGCFTSVRYRKAEPEKELKIWGRGLCRRPLTLLSDMMRPVSDAFFPTGALFRLAASVRCISIQRPLVTPVIRAKKNCVAFRKPKKNKLLKPVPSRSLNTVRCCREACERFVMPGSISLGLLILTALKHTDTVWEQFDGYLRTRSRSLPSERTVKYVTGPVILRNFLISAPIGIMREIRNRCFGRKTFL